MQWDWIQTHIADLAALAFAVVSGLTIIVTAIGKLWPSKWVGRFGAWLHKLHDVLSPFALGNQPKLASVSQPATALPQRMLPPRADDVQMSTPDSKPFGG